MQSPIDLLDQRVEVFPNLGKLKRDYSPAPATVKNRGHDITVAWKGNAGKININGSDYKLLQCHFHSPSEHTFNGTRYHLELHIVHLSSNGTIAVVGIIYKYGRPDPFLAKVIGYISSIGKEKEKELGIVNPGDIKFGSRKYYRYIGSLTVPPCTEGVVWTIIKKVRTVSREQVQALRDAVHD
ncbi:carbonic anhydrase, partial [Sarracenia purpurea var. burkii]